MFSKDDILARLIAGEDAQSVAQEAADAINGALQEFEDMKKTAAAREAKKEVERQAKRADAKEAIKAFVNFYNSWYEDGEDMDDKELDTAADLLLAMFDDIDVKESKSDHGHSVKVTMKNAAKTDDDILRNFLSKL